MYYAHVQDIAATWGGYARIIPQLLHPPPHGLVVHVAGPTEAGFRTIAIWEGEAAWCRFRDERLAPALAALGASGRLQPTLRELQVQHTVFGHGVVTLDGGSTGTGRFENRVLETEGFRR